MNFIIFDLILLVIFIVFASYFLYKNRKNLQKDGPFYLYRTKWGIRLIDRVGGKYQKTLKALSYVSIFIGYILMIAWTSLRYPNNEEMILRLADHLFPFFVYGMGFVLMGVIFDTSKWAINKLRGSLSKETEV